MHKSIAIYTVTNFDAFKIEHRLFPECPFNTWPLGLVLPYLKPNYTIIASEEIRLFFPHLSQ